MSIAYAPRLNGQFHMDLTTNGIQYSLVLDYSDMRDGLNISGGPAFWKYVQRGIPVSEYDRLDRTECADYMQRLWEKSYLALMGLVNDR